jgi:hypothetical protein
MNFRVAISIFLCFLLPSDSCSVLTCTYHQSNLLQAGAVFINKVLVKKMTTLPTVNLAMKKSRQDFVDELMKRIELATAWRLETISFISPIKKHRRLMNVFLIRDFRGFMEIYQKLTPENFKLNGFYPSYQIWLLDGKIDGIEEIFKLMWRIQVYNVNVMFEDEKGEVLVQTFHPFSDGFCGDTTVKTINKFKDGRFEKNLETLFVDKMENLHGCPVRVAIADDIEPHVVVKESSDGSKTFSGRDVDLINALAKMINFTVNITFVGSEGYVFDNGTAMGPFKALIDGEADISISDWWLKANRLNLFDATSSYISENTIFVVPHGSDFTALEKLIYPFHYQSWIAIISFLLIGIFVIFIIQRRSTDIQDFVFGREIRGNSLKLFAVFFGVSLRRLPSRNFARYLLMMFIIYSLIIRTLYQGSFYELLKSKKRHEEIQSIDEIIQKEMRVFVLLQNVDLFQGPWKGR